MTTMTSELSKYLNEQLGVFFKCETIKMKLAKNIKNGSLVRTFLYNVRFYQILSKFYLESKGMRAIFQKKSKKKDKKNV